MGVDWYNSIALRNGGYKSNAQYLIEGISAEDIFEEELIRLLHNFNNVLDAGCGHGDFTMKMSKHTHSLIGFDNSIEMIKIANMNQTTKDNLEFVYATTKEELPFRDNQFDLIYDRRGPTSILNHSRILKSGGCVFGIHSSSMELVKERLYMNGFINIDIREYKNSSRMVFPNREELIKFISSIPGNPDYTNPQYKEELEQKISESTVDGVLQIKEYKYIWKAYKP